MPVSLDDQIESKAAILETISERWREGDSTLLSSAAPRLILGGHSIGAYMALELVRRRLTPIPVAAVHLLFPTLHQVGQSPNARKLAWLLRANDVPASSPWMPSVLMLVTFFVSVALKFIRMLPLPIVQFFVLIAAPTQPPDAVRVTTNFALRTSCVQQALSMARDELRLVRQVQALSEDEVGERDMSRTKLRAYWASGDLDGWAPEATRNAVEEALGLKGYELPADLIEHHKSGRGGPGMSPARKKRTFTIDEIRKVRTRSKRRALAGMVRAGASASYGIASSLGNMRYPGARLGSRPPPPAPSSGTAVRSSGPRTPGSVSRIIKRRPSLVAARASRRFDGSIVIEPAEAQDTNGEELDLLAKDPDDTVGGLVFSPAAVEPSLQEAFELNDLNATSTKGRASKEDNKEGKDTQSLLEMPDRASIVCRIGMPHAFVLEHGDKMAAISSAMVIADAL